MLNIKKKVGGTFTCIDCSTPLEYTSGTTCLICEHCGAKNNILQTKGKSQELDFDAFLEKKLNSEETFIENFVKCSGCEASSTLNTDEPSAFCPFCSTPLVGENAIDEKIIRPTSILPFKLDITKAKGALHKWVEKLWFLPHDFKEATSDFDHFKGVYIPYWTFNIHTNTKYNVQLAKHYYETEYYTIMEGGKSVNKERQVKKTRWDSVSGSVPKKIDKTLIVATKSLPKKYIYKLEPWGLENLIPFDESYLTGFITEKYQIDLGEGFKIAKGMADPKIQKAVKKAIGSNEQRGISMHTQYKDITFKLMLFPVFVSTYRFNGKLFQFLVNGRTGEVQGQRPYNLKKLALIALATIAIIAFIIFIVKLF